MKWNISVLVFVAVFSSNAYSQNRVPNPSFEYQIACPNNNLAPQLPVDELAKAFPWESYTVSPDLFAPCVTDPNMWCDAPFTGLGYQQAFEGENFVGFFYSWTDYQDNIFEVLGCPLIEPLTIGASYLVSMRFSLSDTILCASNHIGALFLTHDYNVFTNPMTFSNHCHVCADSVIIDYQGWTEVSGIFVADSAYTHIAIGHFLGNTTFVSLPNAPGPGGSYYFVDYICVVPEGGDCSIPLYASQPHQSAAFTAYPNPIIKSQSPILHFSKESSVEVYDLMGQQVGHYENVLEFDAGGWPAGVYLLRESGGGITKIIVME